MILHVATASPWWLKDAATAALVLHIGGGGTGLVAGAIALGAPKGGRVHRIAGDVFVVAMVVMGSIAAIVAPMINQPGNSIAGVFAVYLVLTGWATMRTSAGALGRYQIGAAVFPALGAILLMIDGWRTAQGSDGMAGAMPSFIAALVAALAAGGDLRMILARGISGPPRLARHLWRMCVGLFVATGSFFLGQQKVLPAFMKGSPLLYVLAFAPLALMVVWLVRVRARPAPRLRPQPV